MRSVKSRNLRKSRNLKVGGSEKQKPNDVIMYGYGYTFSRDHKNYKRIYIMMNGISKKHIHINI